MSVQLYLKGRAFKMHSHIHIQPGKASPSSLREPKDEDRPDL